MTAARTTGAGYTSLPRVEQAIQESLQSRAPAILTTDCPEAHQAYYGALVGCCSDVGPTARDGTERFQGADDDGEYWDVRLRLDLPRERATSRGALRKVLAHAREDLTMAMACYMRERTTQAATAVAIALVNADQARADVIDAGEG